MSVTRPATLGLRRLPVRRMLAVTPLVAIALGAAFMGARAHIPDNQIVPGVRVGDVDLGGKSVEEAKPLIEQWAARKQAATLQLRVPPDAGVSRVWNPDAAKLGLSVNVTSTLDAASKAGREDVAGQVSHIFTGTKPIQVQPLSTIDEAKLKGYLKRQIAADVFRKPKNARFMLIKGGGFGSRHDQSGLALDVEASAAAVKQEWLAYLAQPPAAAPTPSATPDKPGDGAVTPPDGSQGQPAAGQSLLTDPGSLEVNLAVKSTPAAITLADVGQINTVLGSKSSYVNGTTARLGNIRIAAGHINGTLLKPGDVFSYNKVVGPRDEDEGYREAPILVRGKHDKGIAGGICQTSGTLFNAVLNSGLQIVQREHHSTPIGYLPIGLDATVSYGSLDFKFKNDTAAPVYVAASLNGRSLTFSLFGKEVPGRKVSLVRGGVSRTGASYQTQTDRSKPAGYRRVVERAASGAHVTWYRIIRENGQVVHRDVISSHYGAHPGVVVVGAGPAKPRPLKRGPAGPGPGPGVPPGNGGAGAQPPPVGALQ